MLEAIFYFIILFIFLVILFKFTKSNFTKYYLAIFSIINFILIIYASVSTKYYSIPIEHTIYFLLLILLFSFGYIFFENKINKDDGVDCIVENKENLGNTFFSKKVMLIISLLTFIVIGILIYYLINFKKLESQYGIATTRLLKFTLGYLFKTPLEYAFFRYVIEALISVYAIMVSYMLVNKMYKNITFFEMILSIFLYSEIGRGRFIYFDILVYIVFFIIILHSDNLLNFIKQNKKSLSVTFLFVTFVLFVVTFARMNLQSNGASIIDGIESTLDQVIVYFSGPYKMFSEAIKMDYRAQLAGNNITTFPLFASVDELIKLIFNFFGGNFVTTNTLISNLTNTPIVIGKNLEMNAFYTGFLNFYLSGGLVGSCFLMFFYGIIISFIHKLLMKSSHVINYLLMALISYPTLMIMLRWEFQSAPFFCSLALLLIIKFLIERKKI